MDAGIAEIVFMRRVLMGKMRDWKTELSETCNELKAIKRKFGHKRNKYLRVIQNIIRKKYGVHIPIKYKMGKHNQVFKTIGLLVQRGYLGYRQALEDMGKISKPKGL